MRTSSCPTRPSAATSLRTPRNDAERTECALPPDNLRQKIIYKRLDLVRAENRREGRSVRRRAGGEPITRALGVGAVEPAWHLRARKPATDRLDKGRTVEPRLAQAGTGRKFAAGASFARGAVALKASGLDPRCLAGRKPRGVLREGGRAKRHPDGQTKDRCSHCELRLHICLPAAGVTLRDGAGPRNVCTLAEAIGSVKGERHHPRAPGCGPCQARP